MAYDVVISNSKLNCYGFRVLTTGIDIEQYLRNPIMLWMHTRPWGDDKEMVLPLGIVENVRFEGDDLKGTLKFDEADDFSKTIKAKWDAGTIKMVSPGLECIEESEDVAYLLPGQRRGTITKSKLTEVSVVDMGANDDALCCYKDGKVLKLASGGDNDFLKPINIINENDESMKSIALFLGLPEGASEADILAKVTEIKLAADKVNQLELAAETQRELAITTEVETAITLKKVTADKKDHFIALGKKVGVEDLRATLLLMTPARKPGDVINMNSGGGETEYKKLSEVPEAELKLMRENDKETYQRLFKAEYGTEICI